MDTFTWKDEYELGISTIDDQHKELFKVANNYIQELTTGDNESCDKLLLKLKRHILQHFNFEEQVMKRYNYKEFQTHQSEHYQIIKEILEMEGRLKNEEKGLILEIMLFLNKWIVEHINNFDRKYVDLFKKRGLI